MSLSKRFRFEILKRDGFKCRYCGTTAATSLLHVDHVVPSSKGGTDDPENLVAACADCNGGKSNISLGEHRVAPSDSVSAMIEHAEQMQAYLQAVKAREEYLSEMADYAHDLMTLECGYTSHRFRARLRAAIKTDGLDDIVDAIMAVAAAGIGSSEDRERYFYGVLRNIRANGGT